MHTALGDNLPVKMGQLFQIPYVLQQHGTARTRGQMEPYGDCATSYFDLSTLSEVEGCILGSFCAAYTARAAFDKYSYWIIVVSCDQKKKGQIIHPLYNQGKVHRTRSGSERSETLRFAPAPLWKEGQYPDLHPRSCCNACYCMYFHKVSDETHGQDSSESK